ncbi:TPA: LPXTG cell wall anchor domain-containing protein, partial [Streptococcus suis]
SEKAEEEAKKNQNGTGSEISVAPAEDALVTKKGDPAYRELPTINISDVVKQVEAGKKDNTQEEQSSAHVSNMVLQAGESTVREVQNTSTVLQNSAEKSVSSRADRAKTLPQTGEQSSILLSTLGLGLSGIAILRSKRKMK